MLNLDTHVVVKLLSGGLTDMERGRVSASPLAISDIVIWEVAKLHQLGRISLSVQSAGFEAFLKRVRVIPIDVRVVSAMAQLDFRSDPADELIAATSVAHSIKLLTRDSRILASKIVPLAK